MHDKPYPTGQLLFAVLCSHSHWVAVVVDFEKHTLLVHDPCGTATSQRHDHNAVFVIFTTRLLPALWSQCGAHCAGKQYLLGGHLDGKQHGRK